MKHNKITLYTVVTQTLYSLSRKIKYIYELDQYQHYIEHTHDSIHYVSIKTNKSLSCNDIYARDFLLASTYKSL